MAEMQLRAMERRDWWEVADLIYVSTNYWYETHGRQRIFSGGPEATELFCRVYEALDPGCCVVAEHTRTGRIMGSCFYHPRETHVSLGIMNVHPSYFGTGVARALLRFIIDFAEQRKQPVRLVSSAINLDSFSLYTRAGFVPRCTFQDLIAHVPAAGMAALGRPPEGIEAVREATPADVEAIADLEMELNGIRRAKDYRYFVENREGIWSLLVYERDGRIEGFLASVADPGSNMLGPGVTRGEQEAAALIYAQLDRHRGRSPVFLVPVTCSRLVAQVYAWGARNCELHLAQVRGACPPFGGVTLPTFMPETG